MDLIPVRLTRVTGETVTVNACAMTGMFVTQVGRSTCTIIRTSDGNEWTVRESPDAILEAVGKQRPSVAAPLKAETKAAKGATK